MTQYDSEAFDPSRIVYLAADKHHSNADGLDPERKKLHEKLTAVLNNAPILRKKINDNQYLPITDKSNLALKLADITSIASQRADSQGEDILTLKEQIENAENKLAALEKNVEKRIEKPLSSLRAETEIALENLEKLGADSKDNSLHDKYCVVKRIRDTIGFKKNDGENPVEILNNVEKNVLKARDYGVNNKEAYRKAFSANRQPSGMDILNAHRHPILDRLISAIKQIFNGKSKSNGKANPNSKDPVSFLKRPLPETKTLAAMPTLSTLSK